MEHPDLQFELARIRQQELIQSAENWSIAMAARRMRTIYLLQLILKLAAAMKQRLQRPKQHTIVPPNTGLGEHDGTPLAHYE